MQQHLRRRSPIPTHASVPPYSRPSSTSPSGGPERGPTTVRGRDGRRAPPGSRTEERIETAGQYGITSDSLISNSHPSTTGASSEFHQEMRQNIAHGQRSRRLSALLVGLVQMAGCTHPSPPAIPASSPLPNGATAASPRVNGASRVAGCLATGASDLWAGTSNRHRSLQF